MKKAFFKFLASINKVVFPSFGKKQLEINQAAKWQMAIIAWRYYVTRNSLD